MCQIQMVCTVNLSEAIWEPNGNLLQQPQRPQQLHADLLWNMHLVKIYAGVYYVAQAQLQADRTCDPYCCMLSLRSPLDTT